MHGTDLQRLTWDYFRKFRGEFLGRNGQLGENPAGYQCVNVPNDFWAQLAVPSLSGNASAWIGAEDGYRKWLTATARLRLVHGDVAVFRTAWVGPNGHVSVVLDGSRLLVASVDQNWPLGSPVSEVWHNRASIAGVLRLRGNYG